MCKKNMIFIYIQIMVYYDRIVFFKYNSVGTFNDFFIDLKKD